MAAGCARYIKKRGVVGVGSSGKVTTMEGTLRGPDAAAEGGRARSVRIIVGSYKSGSTRCKRK